MPSDALGTAGHESPAAGDPSSGSPRKKRGRLPRSLVTASTAPARHNNSSTLMRAPVPAEHTIRKSWCQASQPIALCLSAKILSRRRAPYRN
jgi:hypothetical protein